MLVLPVFMTFLFVNFPAGLVLYWLTNNVLTISQQLITDRFLFPNKALVPAGAEQSSSPMHKRLRTWPLHRSAGLCYVDAAAKRR